MRILFLSVPIPVKSLRIGHTIRQRECLPIERAVAATADAIVSGDKKHLLPLRHYRQIPILSPADFLRILTKPGPEPRST